MRKGNGVTRLQTMRCPLCRKANLKKIKFAELVALRCMEPGCVYEKKIYDNHYPHRSK